jgi:hypothetical protein
MGKYLDDLWDDLEQTWDLAMKVNDLPETERGDPNQAWEGHFKNDNLVDVVRTEAEKSADNNLTKVFCTNIYGIQYNNETRYWVPFRHGEVDVVKFSED